MRGFVTVLTMLSCTSCSVSRAAEHSGRVRAELFELERRSHERWLARDTIYLDRLMAESYLFVAMNGALETKGHVTGRGADPTAVRQSPLRVQSLRAEPEQLILEGNTAVVIGTVFIEAMAGGRPIPNRMRSLSTFVRRSRGEPWRLVARSLTPLLSAPG